MTKYCPFCKKTVEVRTVSHDYYQSESGMWVKAFGAWCTKCDLYIADAKSQETKDASTQG